MKTLLAITTYNQLKYTQKTENSIPKIDGMDVVFVDDKSDDETVKYLKSKNRNVIEKERGAGLTDSWNIAYRKFKSESYDGLIISNNDVLFNYTLADLVGGLEKYPLVLPLTSLSGAGCSKKRQSVSHYYPKFKEPQASNETLHIKSLEKINKKGYTEINWLHGFCFGLNRDVIKAEVDPEHLFHPKNINCHQEQHFYNRIIKWGIKPRVCLSTFVFHYVSKTLQYQGQIKGVDSRNVLDFNRR